MKRHGVSSHRNDCTAISSGGYSASHFAGAAIVHMAGVREPREVGKPAWGSAAQQGADNNRWQVSACRHGGWCVRPSVARRESIVVRIMLYPENPVTITFVFNVLRDRAQQLTFLSPIGRGNPTALVAPPHFEAKRHGASEHGNNCMAVSSGGYAASNFAGSVYALHMSPRAPPIYATSWPDCTIIIPTTVCRQSNYVETYRRYSGRMLSIAVLPQASRPARWHAICSNHG